jgi:hypothetical protein
MTVKVNSQSGKTSFNNSQKDVNINFNHNSKLKEIGSMARHHGMTNKTKKKKQKRTKKKRQRRRKKSK